MSTLASPGAGVHLEDVTANADRKIRALLCHETQHKDPSGIDAMVRAWMKATGERFELGDGRLAEAFLVVETR